jgi:hypothetical protein
VTQVLNFGVPTQIDVQVQGRARENNKQIAALLQQKMANIPGLVDAHTQQVRRAGSKKARRGTRQAVPRGSELGCCPR